MGKQVCQLDENGCFIGMTSCQPSPLEPGVYLIPGRAIDVETAPEVPEGKLAKWVVGSWEFIDIPTPAEETEPEGPVEFASVEESAKAPAAKKSGKKAAKN